MPQRRFAILRADIGRELDNLKRLVAEAEEWQPRLAEWPEAVRVRTERRHPPEQNGCNGQPPGE
jgi:hypothetical protein